MKLDKFTNTLMIPLLAGIALISSFWQTAEKIHSLKNPDVALSCNINPIVDCGTVLNHSLSSVFGVPNSMIGMLMFGFIAALGFVLWKKRTQPKIVILMLAGLVAAALAFSIWFFIVSLYVINKVCIFCVFIWVATIPMSILTLREFDKEIFGSSKLLKKTRKMLSDSPMQYIVGTYLLAVVIFLFRFREYYF